MTKSESGVTRRRAIQGVLGAATLASAAPSAASSPSTPGARLQELSEGWRFHRGDATGAESPDFQDAGWRKLDIPHDWSIEDLPSPENDGVGAVWTEAAYPLRNGPFDRYASEGQIATGWTVGGVGWYRRTILKPESSPHGKVEVRFDGVYMNSDVWINGIHLGNHPYGYTGFGFDLTPHLKAGASILAVRVDNAGRNSRWYSGSGIFRKVWLSNAGDVRIPEHGIYVTAPDVSRDSAVAQVQVAVENGLSANTEVRIRVRFEDSNGAPAGESEAPATIGATASATVQCRVQIAKPRLWSVMEPHLYRVEVRVESAGKVLDSRELRYGLRSVEFDAAQGLRINGENLKLRGGCIHHDNGPLGAAAIPRAEERKIELLKANGYNAIRTSHNPPSPELLDACDRLGMLVIDEAFDCWEDGKNDDDYHKYFQNWWKRDLEAMILRDRNHPSIILWSIGNEIHERAEPRGVEVGKALAQHAHELDPSRKVTAAICAPWDHPKATWQDLQPAFSYLDVGGYNYEFEQYEKDHAAFPDRVMVGTESFPEQALANWNAVEKNSWVIGDFVWTAVDYLGESGIGHSGITKASSAFPITAPYPWFNSFCGDLDLIGNKKPQSYFRDVVWRRSPIEMAIQRPVPEGLTEQVSLWGWSDELRSWTWPGFEGKAMKVRVYTRGDRVRLFLNGQQVAEKDLTDQDHLKAEFQVSYAPGELKATAFDGGKEMGTLRFATAGAPHRIVLKADRVRLTPSRDDLSYLIAQVVDQDGRLVPDAALPVSFTIAGAGSIAAVGNANPKDLASFRQRRRMTYHGMCAAIIQPSGRPGAIDISASSPGLGIARATLQVLEHSASR